jgi:hypothetical protein
MNIVELKALPNKDAIEYAKGLLARCESGEVVEVTAVEVRDDGRWHSTGTATKSNVTRIGHLFSAAVDAVKQSEEP